MYTRAFVVEINVFHLFLFCFWVLFALAGATFTDTNALQVLFLAFLFFHYTYFWIFIYLWYPSEVSPRYCTFPGGNSPGTDRSPWAWKEPDSNPCLLLFSGTVHILFLLMLSLLSSLLLLFCRCWILWLLLLLLHVRLLLIFSNDLLFIFQVLLLPLQCCCSCCYRCVRIRPRKSYFFLRRKNVFKNAHIGLKFSGCLTNTLKNILCIWIIVIKMKTFHRQQAKQLIVAKSATAVKEEKHKRNYLLILGRKITFFFIVYPLNA